MSPRSMHAVDYFRGRSIVLDLTTVISHPCRPSSGLRACCYRLLVGVGTDCAKLRDQAQGVHDDGDDPRRVEGPCNLTRIPCLLRDRPGEHRNRAQDVHACSAKKIQLDEGSLPLLEPDRQNEQAAATGSSLRT